MKASSLVLRTRRRSCYQGRGDLHQARAADPDPRQLRRSTSPPSPTPGWSAARCSCVSTQHFTWIIRAEEAASQAASASAAPCRSASARGHASASGQAEAAGPVSSSKEDAHSELDNIILICKTMDKNVDTSESS